MILKTDRLLLRTPIQADASRIASLAGDFEVASMTGTIPHPYSEEMAASWIGGLHKGEEGVAFAIDLGSELIGCIGYRALAPTHAEMGYWIGRPYWGQGYATEAARAMIGLIFAREEYDYLTAGHFADNPASARVISKLGFEASGEIRRRCAARGLRTRCLTYRLERDRAMALHGEGGRQGLPAGEELGPPGDLR